MKKFLAVLFFSFIICANAYADSITLKSGKKIDGAVIERSTEWVKVDTNGVKFTYFLDEVDEINGEKIAVTVKKAIEPVQQAAKEEGVDLRNQPKAVPVIPEKLSADNAAVQPPKINIPLAITFFSLIFVFGYLYPSLCLQFIAVKTNNHPVWLAWVPVANLFLMCKVGGVNYLWLLLLLLMFVPILGMVVNFALGGFLWFKIAKARNKPGWLGILAVVPIAGLVVFGYLAFSD